MDRRTLLTSVGTGITGLGVGGLVLGSTDNAAAASVTMGELSISDDSQTTADGTISNVKCSVSGKWKYELPAGSPAEWKLSLRVADGDTWATVGQTSGQAEYNQYNAEYTVSGSITETDLYNPSFFEAPGPGKQKSVSLPLEVWFRVLSESDSKLANETVEDTATVTVAQESINASLYGQVRGQGSLSITK